MLIFWGISILFAIAGAPFGFPLTEYTGSNFFTSMITAILARVRWYLTVVWIYISLMVSDVGHLLKYLLASYVFFGKMSVQVFSTVLNWIILLIFLLLSCRNFFIYYGNYPHLLCGLHRLFKIQFFRAVLSSQQNWGEGTEFPYTPDPRHAFVTIKKPTLKKKKKKNYTDSLHRF